MRSLIIALFLASSTIAACTTKCEDLANRICDCDEDPNQRSACRTQVINDSRTIQFKDADQKVCEAKLKTCDKECVALRNNDRAACGFTKE
jgi:archaellum component FlaG (FlaF/FlaG flagellin family)